MKDTAVLQVYFPLFLASSCWYRGQFILQNMVVNPWLSVHLIDTLLHTDSEHANLETLAKIRELLLMEYGSGLIQNSWCVDIKMWSFVLSLIVLRILLACGKLAPTICCTAGQKASCDWRTTSKRCILKTKRWRRRCVHHCSARIHLFRSSCAFSWCEFASSKSWMIPKLALSTLWPTGRCF